MTTDEISKELNQMFKLRPDLHVSILNMMIELEKAKAVEHVASAIVVLARRNG